jgi:2-keto-3-deoxy-L-rhamnonate aldolase RhmA
LTTHFRDIIKTRELLLGTWISSTDPTVVEAIAQSDFDFIIFDCEHGGIDRVELVTNLIAASAAGRRSIVRLGGDDVVNYMHPIDSGADGVLVPRIRTAGEVRRAVDLCRYPPIGSRGYGPRRAGGYTRRDNAYAAGANDSVAVMVQIETREAVDNLDEILAVEGLDGVLVGRNDLAGSLGLPRDHQNPELLEVTEAVLTQARSAGLARGIACGADPQSVELAQRLGANLIGAGNDYDFLVRAIDGFIGAVRRPAAPLPAIS